MDSHMVLSTMYPKYSVRKEVKTVIMEQKLLKRISHLLLDTARCVGCGICVDACPK